MERVCYTPAWTVIRWAVLSAVVALVVLLGGAIATHAALGFVHWPLVLGLVSGCLSTGLVVALVRIRRRARFVRRLCLRATELRTGTEGRFVVELSLRRRARVRSLRVVLVPSAAIGHAWRGASDQPSDVALCRPLEVTAAQGVELPPGDHEIPVEVSLPPDVPASGVYLWRQEWGARQYLRFTKTVWEVSLELEMEGVPALDADGQVSMEPGSLRSLGFSLGRFGACEHFVHVLLMEARKRGFGPELLAMAALVARSERGLNDAAWSRLVWLAERLLPDQRDPVAELRAIVASPPPMAQLAARLARGQTAELVLSWVAWVARPAVRGPEALGIPARHLGVSAEASRRAWERAGAWEKDALAAERSLLEDVRRSAGEVGRYPGGSTEILAIPAACWATVWIPLLPLWPLFRLWGRVRAEPGRFFRLGAPWSVAAMGFILLHSVFVSLYGLFVWLFLSGAMHE